MSSILLYNCHLLTMQSDEIIKGGALGVEGDRITLVTDNRAQIDNFLAQHPACESIDCQGRLLMPGLINTHTHASMSLMRNLYEDMELRSWLEEHVWPFESHLSDEDIESGARLSIAEMLLGGVTTFVDMYFSMSSVARAAEQMGIRAHLTETLIVGREESFKSNLSSLVDSVQGSKLVTAGIAPHAPYTIPPPSAEVVREMVERYNLPINTHLCETESEPQMVGRDPVEYFDECGFLTPTTLLAHCVHLDDRSIELIVSRGCSVSHCAESNMKLSSGVARLGAMYHAGVNCTIGTDGVCSNNDLDMWGEMRSAALLHRVTKSEGETIPAFEMLKMASVNGARALHRDGELGVLREGALADVIMVDINGVHHRPHNNLISSLLFCAKPSDVVMTMVGGKIVARNGELVAHNIDDICADVERRTRDILEKMMC